MLKSHIHTYVIYLYSSRLIFLVRIYATIYQMYIERPKRHNCPFVIALLKFIAQNKFVIIYQIQIQSLPKRQLRLYFHTVRGIYKLVPFGYFLSDQSVVLRGLYYTTRCRRTLLVICKHTIYTAECQERYKKYQLIYGKYIYVYTRLHYI